VTWQAYGENLEEKLKDLHDRVHKGSYRAQPARRTYIPKPDGSKRPLSDPLPGGQGRPQNLEWRWPHSRNRWFESVSLQRRVRVSRDFALPHREPGFSRGRAG
jgi:hypothetical protein